VSPVKYELGCISQKIFYIVNIHVVKALSFEIRDFICCEDEDRNKKLRALHRVIEGSVCFLSEHKRCLPCGKGTSSDREQTAIADPIARLRRSKGCCIICDISQQLVSMSVDNLPVCVLLVRVLLPVITTATAVLYVPQ
jgi:hypothetical protein